MDTVFKSFFSTAQLFIRSHQSQWWERQEFFLFLMAYASFLGIFFTFFIPPFHKADEITHFFRTISVAQGRLFCTQHAGMFENDLPESIVAFPPETSIVDHPTYLQQRDSTGKINFAHQQRVACTLPFVPYMPTALILMPLVAFNTDPEIIFYLGRLANLLLGLLIVWWALKTIPSKLRLLPATAILLPMTWHQMSSFSKDSLHIAFGLLGISLLLSFLETKKKIPWQKIYLFCASLFLSIIARPQYFPLIFLVFMIPQQLIHRLKNSGEQLVFKLGFVTIIFFSVLLSLKMDLYSVNATKLGVTEKISVIDADAQTTYLLLHPQALVTLPYYTLIHHGQFFLITLIGAFGSLDVLLDWFIYILFFAFFTHIITKTQPFLPSLSKEQFLALTLSMAGSIMGVLMAMYLYATPVGNFLVNGVQGRYFMVVLPLVLWWLAEVRRRVGKSFEMFFLFLILASVIKVTLGWY